VLALLRQGRRALLLAALCTTGFSAPAAAQLAERCASCHGTGGTSVTPGIPSIAAQPKVFLENLLILVREGVRGSEAMQQQMKGVSDRDIIALATHFSRLPIRPAPGAADAELMKRGRLASAKYRCGICHLRDYRGREGSPRLAGQREEYLVDIMRAFRDAPPPGTESNMSAAMYGVSDADIRAMAHFLARRR
jgi:cytochrome c553